MFSCDCSEYEVSPSESSHSSFRSWASHEDPKCDAICRFIKSYRLRIFRQLKSEEQRTRAPFPSFYEKHLKPPDESAWLEDNHRRFFKNTPNEVVLQADFLSELGFITCMEYSNDGETIAIGYSTGLIQNYAMTSAGIAEIITLFGESLANQYANETDPNIWYPMFYYQRTDVDKNIKWVEENKEKFLKGTANKILNNRWFFSEMGGITALDYTPNGVFIIVGHSSGMIQLRDGLSGNVILTLRSIQFPPRPVYSIQHSPTEERVCYASCMDGTVYRIEIPDVQAPIIESGYCIKADPALECLTMQFYGAPGITTHCTPLLTQRSPALSMGIPPDQSHLIVGYADSSIKIYDIETQDIITAYKIHKLRIPFVPKRLLRIHTGQVCALRCHMQRPKVFASASWDKTMRIWDARCKVGCVMTFEGVNVCSDSIDLNRDQAIAGSWQPTEALTVWDLVAKKRLSIIRVQNRRPNVDGEYIYACRYWRSSLYNRKGKYAIIGGSGTQCVEVINLHNRYIACSYPAKGTVVAVASYQDRIAFGGTAPIFEIVSFHEPKHEKYDKDKDSYGGYSDIVIDMNDLFPSIPSVPEVGVNEDALMEAFEGEANTNTNIQTNSQRNTQTDTQRNTQVGSQRSTLADSQRTTQSNK